MVYQGSICPLGGDQKMVDRDQKNGLQPRRIKNG